MPKTPIFSSHDYLYREPRASLLHTLDRFRIRAARALVSFFPILSDPGRSWLTATLFPSRRFIVVFEPGPSPSSTPGAPGGLSAHNQSAYATLVANLTEAGYLDPENKDSLPPHTVIMAAASAVSALIQRSSSLQQLNSLRDETNAIALYLRDNYAREIARRDHDGLTLSQVVIRYLARERQAEQAEQTKLNG